MSSRKNKKQCVYCGDRAGTVDHVPPRRFYGAIPPPNLITVPSCVGCNRGFNVDDDYVRLVLATYEGTRGVAERNEILPAILRYSQMPEARRSLEMFYGSLGTAYHQNPAGVVIRAQYHEIDMQRMEGFGKRVTRALYYREKRSRLPDSYGVEASHRLVFARHLDLDENRDFLEFILVNLLSAPWKVWGGVFAYSWVQSPNDHGQTWWLLKFYGINQFICRTVNPALNGFVSKTLRNH